MIETRTRILGIAPYDGMRTAMEQAASERNDPLWKTILDSLA